MKRLSFEDVLDIAAYERIRRDFRARIMELKKRRRISLGDQMTIVFENADTVRFQLQEMLRLDHIDSPKLIRAELAGFNALIPDDGELSATLFIEVGRSGQFSMSLAEFEGVQDRGVQFRIGNDVICAVFDSVAAPVKMIHAVHYLKFKFTEGQIAAFRDVTISASIGIDHQHYQYSVQIPSDLRACLIRDLTP